jgi:DNA-binding response OmpR family regulator
MVAMLLEDLLDASGYRVLIAERFDVALTMAESEAIDAAILDVGLGKADTFPIADILHGRHIPFLFASGHGRESIPGRFDGVDLLQKPYDMKSLRGALDKLVVKS